MGNRFCSNCGSPLDPATGVCPNCGERQYADNPTMKAENPQYDSGQYDAYAENSYDSYGSGGSYGSGMYASGNQYAVPGQAGGEKKNSAMMTALIVLGAILVLVVAVMVLELTGVTNIFNKKKADAPAGGSPRTAVADENEKDDDGDSGKEMSFTGLITEEVYNGSKIYVLTLEGEREFQPEGKDAETYGSKLSTNKVQVVSDLAAGYVNHSVRVNGTQRFRSESGHKYDVIVTDVTIEDFGEATSAAGQSAIPAVTATQPVQQPVQQPAVITQASGTAISATMTASTYQPHNGSRYYTPTQANDNDPNTCWMAYNPSAHGANVSITMNFGATYRVSGIRFMNGNCWDDVDDVFHLNGRVCGYTVSYDGGVITSGTASDVRRQYTYVTFPTPVNASFITFHVDSTYWGSKYPTVVCLAEIQAVA